MSLCENNCTFNGYDKVTKKALCECGIKTKQLVISELINKTDILSYNFEKKGESYNMITMKCYYTLFTKDGLLKNIGSYILLFTIFFFLISIILFYKCGYPLIEEEIIEIICLKKEEKTNNQEIYIKQTNDININNKKKKKIKKNKKISKKKKIKKSYIESKENSQSFSKLNFKTNKISAQKGIINERKENLNITKISNEKIKFTDFELNSFLYQDALTYDKRKFLVYYFSLIKAKHPIIFSFFPIKDYNSLLIKMDLFFLSFSIYYFINALFFDYPTIHKIYIDKGIYNIIYLIPHILYSFFVSQALIITIKYFSLSERNIYEIKSEKSIEKASDKIYNVKKCLVIKYLCFFSLSLIFLIFFWYYLSSFGAVYQNTQVYLIKNTLISFGFSLIYPFVINLFAAILRIYSLKESNRKCFFIISKIIQFL